MKLPNYMHHHRNNTAHGSRINCKKRANTTLYFARTVKMFPEPFHSSSEWVHANDVLSWKFPSHISPYTLIGRSRAADATSFFIPELDLLLDCGCLVTSNRPSDIFITHTHSDHCLDVTRFVSRSRPPRIHLPVSGVPMMKDFLEKCQILRTAGQIDSDPSEWTKNYELIGVQPGEFFPFQKTMQVRVFDMDHSVPCCGYGFYRKQQKLKAEYQHLTSKEIGNLRRENKDLSVSDEKFFPLFAFLCDTTASIFETYSSELFEFRLIIVECSFIDHEQHAQRACDVKHIIWDDIQPYVLKYPHITFVLIHFSQQYKRDDIRNFFSNLNLPNVVPFV
ncbi:unnamed protein product [Adineta ricciae]|uniref:Metallo-beta-lactamase domain-containing protein n=1 Tax=Adineta ricciae TaxID=249248 RepID=A0A814GRQ8_ADIRI|nr:unnamed protein product [Adineta ricciae]